MSMKRMRTGTGLLVGIAVALSGATLANVTGAVAAAPGDKASPTKSRRVCRSVQPSGSRLARRDCRTQEEWDSIQQKAQDGLLAQQTGQTTIVLPDPTQMPMTVPTANPQNRP